MGSWDMHRAVLTCMLAACASSPGAAPSSSTTPPPATAAPEAAPSPRSRAPVPAPEPARPPEDSASLPETLDRAMIYDGLQTVRDQVMRCGSTWRSMEDQIKVHVQVAPDGHVV